MAPPENSILFKSTIWFWNKMNKILILFAHPALQNSRIHKALISSVHNLEGITFHDLYEEYPEFDIDAKREQKLLEEHDMVVMQFPFFWYSTPAILKQWQDIVLTFGWAFGKGGNALKGKKLMLALSSGGPRDAYHEEGYNRFSIRHLVSPLDQTANLCKMGFIPPFVIHGSLVLKNDEIRKYQQEYVRILTGLRDGSLDTDSIKDSLYVNEGFSVKD